MTADELIRLLFEEYWLATTIFAPSLSFLYAWVTNQTAWWLSSLLLALFYIGLRK